MCCIHTPGPSRGAVKFQADLSQFLSKFQSEVYQFIQIPIGVTQVTGTQEVKVFEDTTPEKFAESIFGMMERFPAAPLSQLLCQQQISELRADYMIAAVPQAETMPRRDGGIVNEFVMLWAVATV